MKLTLIAALLAVTPFVAKAEYVSVTETASVGKVWEPERGGPRLAWVKLVLASQEGYSVILEEISCAKSTYTVLAGRVYDSNGSVVGDITDPLLINRTSVIFPETAIEKIKDYVCSRKI